MTTLRTPLSPGPVTKFNLSTVGAGPQGPAGSQGPPVAIQHAGVPVTARQYLNVSGAGVASVTDNPGNNSTDIVFSGGGSGGGQYNVTLAAGVNSNVNTNGHQSVIYVGGPTAAFSIDGFDHAPGAGEVITVVNTTAFVMSAGVTTGSTSGQRTSVIGGLTASTSVAAGGMMQFTGNSSPVSGPTFWLLTHLGPHRPTEIDVVDLGADPTGVLPSAAIIQVAINYCQTNLSVGVYIPPGTYLLEFPLWISSQVRVRGAGSGFSSLTASNVWTGPILAVGSNQISAPALVTAGSITMLGLPPGAYIDIQKWGIWSMVAGASRLNGYATFEFGCYLNPLSATLAAGATTVIYASSGVSDAGFNQGLGFFLVGGGSGGNFPAITLTTSTGNLSVTSGTTLPANTVTFVSYTYNGTNLKLYQGGVLVGTSTAGSAGYIVVNAKENFTFGEYGASWPAGAPYFGIQNTFEIGEAFFSTSIIHSSAYTPPTGPITLSAGWVMSFAATNQSPQNNRWFKASFVFPGYSNATIWWLYEDGNLIQPTNIIIEGLTLNGASPGGGGFQVQTQIGMNLNSVWLSTFKDILIQYMQHGLIQNTNCVLNRFESININSFQGFGVYALDSFSSEYVNFNIGTGYYALMLGSSAGIFRNIRGVLIHRCFIYDSSPDGDTLTSEYTNCVYDDETPGYITERLLFFSNKNSLKWNWGLVAAGDSTPPHVAALVNCTNIVFENALFGAANGAPIFAFSSPDNFVGRVGASAGASTHMPPKLIGTNQIESAGGPVWIDPSNPGELVIDGQETSGYTVLNFASDADMVVGFNDLLFHTIVLTDTAGVLTTGRNVKLPGWWLRERVIINRTAQTVTILGPTTYPAWTAFAAYTPGIASNGVQYALGGQTASVVTNSGNVYKCTTAISSATTAPTTAIYGKVVTDGSGSWTSFGPVSTPIVASNVTIRVRSDGMQWASTT